MRNHVPIAVQHVRQDNVVDMRSMHWHVHRSVRIGELRKLFDPIGVNARVNMAPEPSESAANHPDCQIAGTRSDGFGRSQRVFFVDLYCAARRCHCLPDIWAFHQFWYEFGSTSSLRSQRG